MPQVTQNAKPVYKKYICDNCNKGEMKASGMVQYTDPLRYEHKCSHRMYYNCESKFFSVSYPFIDYIIEDNEHNS